MLVKFCHLKNSGVFRNMFSPIQKEEISRASELGAGTESMILLPLFIVSVIVGCFLTMKKGKFRSHTPHTTLLGLTVLNYQNAGCHTKHEDKAMRLMSWQERLHLSPTKNIALKGSHLGGLKIYCRNSAMVQKYFWNSFLAVKCLWPVPLNLLIVGHLCP